MAFLFKSKKNQDREKDRVLTSRDGPPTTSSQQSSIASTNTSRLVREEKSSVQRSTPTGSLNSLEIDGAASPDQAGFGRRGDQQSGDLQFRNGPGPVLANPNLSLYPWSQRRLTYTTSTMSPFPRYGAAVNANASKEGDIYVMGGLINSQTVKGDLWMIEANGNMSCYQLGTTSEGPSPRVGHSSLLVGNAFIVYGGDTKIDEADVLDETLYLLNTSTRQWSRALPAGPRPSGRYGHSLNILGSKIYIFGGQVEGYFMNDLAAFDLNQLQMPNNRWEILVPNNDSGAPVPGKMPPARTNHSMVSYNDKMYLFGGTNGFQWFNDIWCYDPAVNKWSQLDCIGYIPVEREGHAAALVDDVMYIFGGRTEDGADLGDLAAFRISSRRWYTFQNMGPSPSPRSGHSMTAVGKSIVVLGGEPSSATSAVNDLALVYVLDTNKIRYPNDAQISSATQKNTAQGSRRPSQSDGSRQPSSRDGSQGPGDRKRLMGSAAVNSPTNGYRSPNGSDVNAPSPVNGGAFAKLPRSAGPSPPAGPPPQGQPPKPSQAALTRNASSERGEFASSPVLSNNSQNQSPVSRDPPKDIDSPTINGTRAAPTQQAARGPTQPETVIKPAPVPYSAPSIAPSASEAAVAVVSAAAGAAVAAATINGPPATPRSKPNRQRGTGSIDSTADRLAGGGPGGRPSSPPPPTRQTSGNPLGRRSSARNSQTVALLKELDSARNRNAWYASELELARKSGYAPNATLSPVLDGRAAESFDDEDKPLIEALLAIRAELSNVQSSVDKQAVLAAKQIAEAEKQRDAAIQEAVYAKARLAAHVGNSGSNGASQVESSREADDRIEEMSRKLAAALGMQKDLQAQLERSSLDNDAEKRARQLADDTVNAAQRRMTELETYKQQTAYELERLKAELHNAQQEAREQAIVAAEAASAAQLLRVDKNDFERQYKEAVGASREDGTSFESLRAAVAASDEMKVLLEQQLDQERGRRESAEAKLASIKAELEARTTEVLNLTQRLRDTEELAEKHANEARTHRQAVLSGLDTIAARNVSSQPNKADVERIAALQAQLGAANTLAKKLQLDADTASDRLRTAEERIAGLEAYQEQSSREGVTIRRQLQSALRETQTLQAFNSDLKNQLASQQLETNAMSVQHNTLKDILSERGISPTNPARSRGSPRESSPGQEARIRSLEQQLAASVAMHEETKQTFAVQAADSETAYRDKLTQLENDYQSAVHYVKGTEKMLKQLKEQLARYKSENSRLKAEVDELETKSSSREAESTAPAGWETERSTLSQKIEALQSDLATSKAQLEQQMKAVQGELEHVKQERDTAQKSNDEALMRLTSSRRDLEELQQENAMLEQRAQEAEQKVGLLLDQVESSVGNYRRRSRQVASMNSEQMRDAAARGPGTSGLTNGHSNGDHATTLAVGGGPGHERQDSSETGSAYGESLGDARNSAALDSLANELETLRSHWEATNKNYRLSNAFDFETATPATAAASSGGGAANGLAPASLSSGLRKESKDESGLGLSESLADWRKRLDS